MAAVKYWLEYDYSTKKYSVARGRRCPSYTLAYDSWEKARQAKDKLGRIYSCLSQMASHKR